MTEARQKGVRKVNENENKSTWNKWGPPRVHRMNWKAWFEVLTRWRLKKTKNERWMLKNGRESSRNYSRKRYGSASAWIFFTETIFLTNFKWIRSTRRAEPFSSSLLPLFIGKRGKSLPPSSPRRARLLPPEATTFWRKDLEGPSGPDCYLNPHFY